MEFAIVGIDGCGKSTIAAGIKELFEQRGKDVGYIRLPDFDGVPRVQFVGGIINRIWRWADARGFKTLIAILGFFVTGLYLLAWLQMRHKEVLLVEHSPYIDLVPYARVYRRRIPLSLVKVIARHLPKPDVAILITIPIELAVQRIVSRGRTLQPHETYEALEQLGAFLREEVERIQAYHILKQPEVDAVLEIIEGHINSTKVVEGAIPF